jgi:hypothetical protein
MVTVFAMLFLMEMAGMRIHHTGSIEIVNILQYDFNKKQSKNEIPCQNDETPIEHVIHYSAINVFVSSVIIFFSTLNDFLPAITFIIIVPVILTYPVLENRVNYCFLISCNYTDRAPPASL